MAPRRLTAWLVAALAALLVAPAAWGAGDPIMPLSQVHRGMHCTARTVVQGTTITTFDVEVLDVVDASPDEDARILIRVSGPAVDSTGIGPGFSGSPVYCPDASSVQRVAGAISEGIGEYGNKTVLATPIEQMLGEPVVPPPGTRTDRRLMRSARPLAVPLAISGLPSALVPAVQDGARRAHRSLLATPSGAAARFAPQNLVPGASVSAGYSNGDLALGAIGVVTYRDGNDIWAFGHPFEGAGRRSLFLQDAYVYDVVNNPSGGDLSTYKLAAPGHDLGTMTGDALAAITGRIGALPPTTPVTVIARDLDTGRVVTEASSVADETDVGTPTGQLPLELLGPLSVATAGTNVFHGAPARQTGRMCATIALRESRHPLRFCDRYVFATGGEFSGGGGALGNAMASDVSEALTIVDGTTFAALHVTKLDVSARVERGARLAYMLSARGPRTAHPGQRIRVRLRIRRLRSTTSTISFVTRLPRTLRPGRQPVVLVGTPDDGSGASL
ncbi:MAG: hypothetical protein QOK31_919, partial [Solirubrobacteraceae bacterium]|nr:hypothetical protein [Solirubrobacteraceae bacterium]